MSPRRSTSRAAGTRSTSSSSPAGDAAAGRRSRPLAKRPEMVPTPATPRAERPGTAPPLATHRCRRRSRPRWPPSSPRSRPTRGACSTRPPWWATRSSRAWRRRSPTCRSRSRWARSTNCCCARWSARQVRRGASRSAIPSCGTRSTSLRPAAGGSAPTGARRASSRARGAGPVQRAHHVEHAASAGDEEAIGLLTAAADELQSPAPATAARFYAAALRLLPDPERSRRVALQRRLADAQAAGGEPLAARATLFEALRTPPTGRAARTDRRRRQPGLVARGSRGRAPPPPRRARATCPPSRRSTACGCGSPWASWRCRRATSPTRRRRSATRATTRARSAEPVFECGRPGLQRGRDRPCRGRVAGLAGRGRRRARPAQPAAARHSAAGVLDARSRRRALGDFEGALADLQRGAEVAGRTGRERVLLVLTAETATTLIELGRIAEAIAAGEEALELARLAGNPRMLLWAQSALASAQLAAGDVAAAVAHRRGGRAQRDPARRARRRSARLVPRRGAGRGRQCASAASPPCSSPSAGRGWPLVLPADRPAAAADLVEAQLALGDLAAAQEALAARRSRGRAGRHAVGGRRHRRRPLGRASGARPGGRGGRGGGGRARTCAPGRAAAARPGEGAATPAAARARLAEGRALAAAGDRPAALRALAEAEAAFDRFGARRRRDEAVRELRRLGHRVLRRAPEGGGLEALTAREHEIAALVAAGRTNREIAEQLVLSPRTIEAHLRNIYGKLGVRSRVELARTAT